MPSVRRLLVLAALTVLTVAPAGSAGTMTLKFPRFSVPAHHDREVCYFVRIPRRKAFDSNGFEIVNLGVNSEFVSHHFLMYAYTGTDMDSFPKKKIVDSKACLDFGPADRAQRSLIGGSQSPKSLQILTKGLAQQILPAGDGRALGIILNSHWINSSDSPQNAAVKVRIFPAKSRGIKRYMKSIFEVTANGFLDVPPGSEKNTGWSWSPGGRDFGGAAIGGVTLPTGPACVIMLTSHMHKRGKAFSVDYVDKKHKKTHLYTNTEYSDPSQIIYDGKNGRPNPLLVKVGERIDYTCTHANGMDGVTQRMGCEEQAGVPPGKSVVDTLFGGRGIYGAAKDCTTDADCTPTDPAYPTRTFTGKCVPANIVFGFTSDDEMCILPGAYYDPNPDVPEDQACNIDEMPLLKK